MSINSAFFNQLKSALVPLLKNVIAKFETDIASVQSCVKTNSSGVLQSPVTAAGGDGASAGKFALDHTQSGQITDENTSTIFGFLSNNTGDLTVGGSGYAMKLRGSATRPTYNGNDLARSSDLPTNPLTLSDKSGYNCNTLYDGKIWLVGSGSNCPSGSQYGALFMMPYRKASGNSKPDYGAQIFIPNGDDSTKPNSMFFRTSLENSWNGWQEVAVEGKANADKVDGYHISVVSALPASPDANTIYIIV